MEEQGAKCKKAMLDQNTRPQQTETEVQGAKLRKTDCYFKRRKHEEMRNQLQNDRRDCNGKVT